MNVIETTIPGVLLLAPRVFRDERGLFLESFNEDRFAGLSLPAVFRQDNHARSGRGVLRGLHYQLRRPQGKLISVIRGAVFDVALDIRMGSPTFGKYFSITLHEDEHRMLWIPPGFAHGYCALTDVVDVVYKCTELYDPGDDHGVLWSDPGLAIPWPITDPVTSPKDATYRPLDPSRGDLPRYTT